MQQHHTMMVSQREVYKLVEKLLQSNESRATVLLKSLLTSIIESKLFPVTGGRLWTLQENKQEYSLEFQYGKVEDIDEKYKVIMEETPELVEIAEKRTIISIEAKHELQSKGIFLFAATGVGEKIQTNYGNLFEFIIAVNGESLGDEFKQVFEIVGVAATNVILKNRSYQERWKIKKDLEKASELQKSLLPDHTLNFHNYDVFGVSVQDDEVGGDYFDYILKEQDRDRMVIVVSDAASKGMSAAIQALFVSGALRMGAKYHSKISTLIGYLNELLCETFPYERFVSMFYCELTTTSTGMMLYANAGHCPPILYKSSERKMQLIQPTGGILGVTKDQHYNVESINLKEKDVLVIVTDGVIESQNEQGQQFGYERLGKMVMEYGLEPSKTIAMSIMEAVATFSANGIYKDDATIVVIKRGREKEGIESPLKDLMILEHGR